MAGERILVIDDSKENRDFVVQYILEPNQYDFLLATNGREGLEMARKHRPDLILLDYNMPEMDGVEVLQALSQDGIEIPTILMTFHSSEQLAVDVFRMGVRDYIPKPFYPEEMESSIYKNLSEARLQRERDALTDRVIHANQELQKRFEELNVLYSIGKHVTDLMNMNQLMLRVVDAAVLLTHAQQGHIHIVQDGQVICRARKRANTVHAEEEAEEIADPISMHILKSRKPLMLTEKQLRKAGITNVAMGTYVPMIMGKKSIGIIGVENVTASAGKFTKHDTALLSAISDYVSIAIANSRNYAALTQVRAQLNRQRLEMTNRHATEPVITEVFDRHPNIVTSAPTERREVTVLCAEIRGHGNLIEKEPAEKVIEILNHYLALAGEVILAWEGTLDRFTGDGLIAVFNAPHSQTDHIHRAADAALALKKVSEEVHKLYGYSLTYGVGLNMGSAVVGMIGTENTGSYSAIGHTVSLAKRLQEYAAPGQILVEESIIKRLGKLAQARPLGELKVKGSAQKAFVYELNGLFYPT